MGRPSYLPLRRAVAYLWLTELSGIFYASVIGAGSTATELLNVAVNSVLQTFQQDPRPSVLWSLQYEQRSAPSAGITESSTSPAQDEHHFLRFPTYPNGVAFDDSMLDTVKARWRQIMGDAADESTFMVFEDREAMAEEEQETD